MEPITTPTFGTAEKLEQRIAFMKLWGELYGAAAALELTQAMKVKVAQVAEEPPIITGKDRLLAEHSTIPPGSMANPMG